MTMLPFKGSLLQPIVDAEGHVQPIAIRYRDTDGAQSVAPAYAGETSFVDVVLERDAASARWSRNCISCPALPARAGIGASSRAPPKPLSERFWLQRRAARHLIDAAIRRA